MLMGKIEEIQKEKALLTSTLPSLTRSPSDDDLLSTDDGSLDEVDTSNRKFLYDYLLLVNFVFVWPCFNSAYQYKNV